MIVSFVNITLYSHWTILVCPCLHCRNPVFFFSGAVKVQYLFWKTFLFYFFGIGLHWQEFFILIGFRSSTFYQYSSILFFSIVFLYLLFSLFSSFVFHILPFSFFFLLPTHILSPSSPKRIFSFQAAEGLIICERKYWVKFNCLLRETLNAFSYKMAVKLILPGFYFRRLFLKSLFCCMCVSLSLCSLIIIFFLYLMCRLIITGTKAPFSFPNFYFYYT